jgi:hypothetical protein
MLDEVWEYGISTVEPPINLKKEQCRLKFANLIKKDFGGLVRAMTIIARQYIFSEGKDSEDFDEEKFALDVLESFNKFNTTLESLSNNMISSQRNMQELQAKVDANEKNIKIISKYLADKEKSEIEAEAETDTDAKTSEAAEEGATEEGKKKWSTKKKVAVGVGIGVGVLAVAGVSYAIYKHNKNKNDYADDDAVAYIDAPSDEDDDVITEI